VARQAQGVAEGGAYRNAVSHATVPSEPEWQRPGTYLLTLRLAHNPGLAIGKLGIFTFPAGVYAYVGSAYGPGGLAARLRHHLRPPRRPHWHLDYFRAAAVVEDCWYALARCEHAWAQVLAALPGAAMPAPRFGATDCTCASHLFHYREPPTFALFRQYARQFCAAEPVQSECFFKSLAPPQ